MQAIGDVDDSHIELAALGLAQPFSQVFDYRDSSPVTGVVPKLGKGQPAVGDDKLGVRLDQTSIEGTGRPHPIDRLGQCRARVSNEPHRIATPEHHHSIHAVHRPFVDLTASVIDTKQSYTESRPAV